MRRISAMYSTSIILALLAVLFVVQAGPASAASPLACGTWKAVPSVNEGDGAELVSVSALAANDVWSVGDFDGSGYRHTLTEHWNGKSWQVVSSPDGGTILNQLTAVVALSTKDVWAVGHYRKDLGSDSTFIEHWDGTQWSIVPSPNKKQSNNGLNAVAAIAANDVWAAGYAGSNQGNYKTLLEHWNGTQWSIVASPSSGQFANFLNGIAGIPQTQQVWTAGIYQTSSSDIGHTLTETNC